MFSEGHQNNTETEREREDYFHKMESTTTIPDRSIAPAHSEKNHIKKRKKAVIILVPFIPLENMWFACHSRGAI